MMVAACRPPGCCSVAVPQTTDEWDDAEYAEYRGPTATADVPDRICTSSAALRDTVPAAESASVPGAQLWPCVVCQQHFFFWLVYKAPLTAETGLSRCWWINVTAMIVWTPRVKCEESSGSHDDTSFATTISAVRDPNLLRCPDKPAWKAQSMCASFALCLLLPGPIGIMRCRKCTKRLLRVGNRAARRWVAQRRMTRHGRPCLVQRSCLALTYPIVKPRNTISTEQSVS